MEYFLCTLYFLINKKKRVFTHYFVSKRSIVSNLAFLLYVSETTDEKSQVDVIFTDIRKAFDTVDHSILLQKFKCYGFGANLLLLFASYLSGKTVVRAVS